MREALLVGQRHAHHRRLVARLRGLQAQVGLLAAVEVRVDLAHAGDRGQHRLLVDEVADRDVGARGAAGDRRLDLCVVEVETGHANGRLCALHVGLGGARSRRRLVELLARHGLRFEQRPGTGQLALRELGTRLRRAHLRLRTRQLRFERPRVDREQQLALLDESAVDEVHRVDRAGNARPQLDVVGGLEPAAELLAVGHRALHRGGDADRRRLRRAALGVGRLAAPAELERRSEQHEGTSGATVHGQARRRAPTMERRGGKQGHERLSLENSRIERWPRLVPASRSPLSARAGRFEPGHVSCCRARHVSEARGAGS